MTGSHRIHIVIETGEQSHRSPGRFMPAGFGASSRTNVYPWYAEVHQESRTFRQQGKRGARHSLRQAALSDHQGQCFEGRLMQEIVQGGQEQACWQEEEQQVVGSTPYFYNMSMGGSLQPFRYNIPCSYPNWLLTVPYPTTVNYIILNKPVNIVLASQFKDSIHLSPGWKFCKKLSYN